MSKFAGNIRTSFFYLLNAGKKSVKQLYTTSVMEESELALSLIAKKHRLKGRTWAEANAFECGFSLPIAVSAHIYLMLPNWEAVSMRKLYQ